jgi:hypothetical protein
MCRATLTTFRFDDPRPRLRDLLRYEDADDLDFLLTYPVFKLDRGQLPAGGLAKLAERVSCRRGALGVRRAAARSSRDAE